MKVNCIDCKHSFMTTDADKNFIRICQLQPPTVVPIMHMTAQGPATQFMSVNPAVNDDSSCSFGEVELAS